MLNNLPFYMLRSLACTLVIEILFALILVVRKKGDILTVALVNFMTNPLVVSLGFISGFFFGTKVRIICTVFLELFAFASEGIAYRYALRYKNRQHGHPSVSTGAWIQPHLPSPAQIPTSSGAEVPYVESLVRLALAVHCPTSRFNLHA